MKYWLRINGRDYGPLSEQEMVENREIPLTADALIAKVGDNEWQPLGTLLPDIWERARSHRGLPPAQIEPPHFAQRKKMAAASGAELALEVEAGAIFLAPRKLTLKSIVVTAVAGFLSVAFAGVLVALSARLIGGKHPFGFGLFIWSAAAVALASFMGQAEGVRPRIVDRALELVRLPIRKSAMARKLRVEFEGAIYHVLNRGNYRRDLFLSAGEAQAFVSALKEAVAIFISLPRTERINFQ